MKIPVLSGSRVAVVNVPDDAVVLRPPPPVETVPEIGAAVRDAVRFPLAGEPLETLVRPGGTATIVLDHPSLPMPSAQADPRQDALFAVVDELERLGVPSQRQTLLVAGGLERRARAGGSASGSARTSWRADFTAASRCTTSRTLHWSRSGRSTGSRCRSTRCCWRATSS